MRAWNKLQNLPKTKQGIHNFTNCVVKVIQLYVFVCLYCRTITLLGCVGHDREMFFKNALPKTRLTDYLISIILTQVTKQLKYLGPVEAIV